MLRVAHQGHGLGQPSVTSSSCSSGPVRVAATNSIVGISAASATTVGTYHQGRTA